jgi:hypothetical protein
VSTPQSNFSHSYYSCVTHNTVLPELVYPNTHSDTSTLLHRALVTPTLCQVPFQHINWLHNLVPPPPPINFLKNLP